MHGRGPERGIRTPTREFRRLRAAVTLSQDGAGASSELRDRSHRYPDMVDGAGGKPTPSMVPKEGIEPPSNRLNLTVTLPVELLRNGGWDRPFRPSQPWCQGKVRNLPAIPRGRCGPFRWTPGMARAAGLRHLRLSSREDPHDHTPAINLPASGRVEK